MRKPVLLALLIIAFQASHAQKIDSIYFNLYTDSLKKGFYNYINVDGKTDKGVWMPLTTHEVTLKANTGRFEGNDLFIDSSYTAESVKVTAELKANPAVKKEVVIYIRKRGFDEPLKTEEQILDEIKKDKSKIKTKS